MYKRMYITINYFFSIGRHLENKTPAVFFLPRPGKPVLMSARKTFWLPTNLAAMQKPFRVISAENRIASSLK